jgi:hypothetical protein
MSFDKVQLHLSIYSRTWVILGLSDQEEKQSIMDTLQAKFPKVQFLDAAPASMQEMLTKDLLGKVIRKPYEQADVLEDVMAAFAK